MFRRGKRSLPCTAGKSFIQINAAGDIFPCYIIPKKYCLGSIREKSLSEIWHSSYSENVRKKGQLSATCNSCVQWYDGYALGQNLEYLLKLVLSHPIIFTKSLGRYLVS
jgi:MoaA/NifB/PqqE/SkfB family radical SAM enzyme